MRAVFFVGRVLAGYGRAFGIVKADDLTYMTTYSLLVNTSRAQRVELDVFEEVPVLGGNHPLLQLPNAVRASHLADVEREFYE